MSITQLICLVDDSADYRTLVGSIFRHVLTQYPIRLFASGEDLLAELPRLNELPGLILLDRHMPDLDGHQTLLLLKQDPAFQTIPVVMMSYDPPPAEIDDCYQAGVNAFVPKGLTFDEQAHTLADVCRYWLGPA